MAFAQHEERGLEEADDGPWDVYLGPITLGRMDERKLGIDPH